MGCVLVVRRCGVCPSSGKMWGCVLVVRRCGVCPSSEKMWRVCPSIERGSDDVNPSPPNEGMDRDLSSMVANGNVPGHFSQPGCGFVGRG